MKYLYSMYKNDKTTFNLAMKCHIQTRTSPIQMDAWTRKRRHTGTRARIR